MMRVLRIGVGNGLMPIAKPLLHHFDLVFWRHLDAPSQNTDVRAGRALGNESSHHQRLRVVADHSLHEADVGGGVVGRLLCGSGGRRDATERDVFQLSLHEVHQQRSSAAVCCKTRGRGTRWNRRNVRYFNPRGAFFEARRRNARNHAGFLRSTRQMTPAISLSEPARSVLSQLRHRPMTVEELARGLHLTPNAVRNQLTKLQDANLVIRSGSRPGVSKPSSLYAITLAGQVQFSTLYLPVLTEFLEVAEGQCSGKQLRKFM